VQFLAGKFQNNPRSFRKAHRSKIQFCKTVPSIPLPSDIEVICHITDVYECSELKRTLSVGVGWGMSESFPSVPMMQSSKIIKKSLKTSTGFETKHAIFCTLLPLPPLAFS